MMFEVAKPSACNYGLWWWRILNAPKVLLERNAQHELSVPKWVCWCRHFPVLSYCISVFVRQIFILLLINSSVTHDHSRPFWAGCSSKILLSSSFQNRLWIEELSMIFMPHVIYVFIWFFGGKASKFAALSYVFPLKYIKIISHCCCFRGIPPYTTIFRQSQLV